MEKSFPEFWETLEKLYTIMESREFELAVRPRFKIQQFPLQRTDPLKPGSLKAVFLMNIVLIGYRGAGKARWAGAGWPAHGKRFVDTDELVERTQGASIRDIVKSKDGNIFGLWRRKSSKKFAEEDHLIIAPGGGAVLDPENVAVFEEKRADHLAEGRPAKSFARRIDRDSADRWPAGRP